MQLLRGNYNLMKRLFYYERLYLQWCLHYYKHMNNVEAPFTIYDVVFMVQHFMISTGFHGLHLL